MFYVMLGNQKVKHCCRCLTHWRTQAVRMGVQWYFCFKSIITCLDRIFNICLWSCQLPLQGANSQHTSILTFSTYSGQDKSPSN